MGRDPLSDLISRLDRQSDDVIEFEVERPEPAR
jgi:hypothetical protein